MDGVLSTVGAELSSDGAGRFDLSCVGVGRSDSLSPEWDCVLCNQFHSDRHVAGHVGFEVREEFLSNVLSVELCDVCLREAAHLQTVELETSSVDRINNLAHFHVSIRLDHGKCTLSVLFKVAPCLDIRVIGDLKDARENSNLAILVEVVEADFGDLLPLQERSVVLDVVHLNRRSHWVVEESVVADNVCLLVIPIDFETESLFANLCHLFSNY